jgi:predicted GNAT family acetyltransferase
VLRTQSPVRALTATDRDEALALCARNPTANVFVAARIEEGALLSMPGALLGFDTGSGLRSMAWASANLVPVECDDEALDAFAYRLRRWRRQCASIFGPSHQVLGLWERLGPSWGRPRAIRHPQPLMSTTVRPQHWGIEPDPRVRLARMDEVDDVLPAAAAMFTDEIGYPPYVGSTASYRQVIAGLVRAGHTYVWSDRGRVMFKADIGSVGVGAAQVQGVWLASALRGQGLAEPLMAAVTDAVLTTIAPEASLYVNDFNVPARATYRALGYAEVGTFSTVLL